MGVTTNTEGLLARLPEIEERVEEWLDTEREEEYHQGMCDEAFSLIHVFIPALCAAVRELAAENERLREILDLKRTEDAEP